MTEYEEHGKSQEQEGEELLYPDVAAVVFGLKQNTQPRRLCLTLTCGPWLSIASVLVIGLHAVLMFMYPPHLHIAAHLQLMRKLSIASLTFFLLEMTIKLLALGLSGPNSFSSNNWNLMDAMIYCGEFLCYLTSNIFPGINTPLYWVFWLFRLLARIPFTDIIDMIDSYAEDTMESKPVTPTTE